MINKILNTYTARLNEYLSGLHYQPEGLATVGPIGNSAGERPDKLVVCLLHIERETAGGIVAPVRMHEGGYVRTQPLLCLNLNIMLAAVYEDSLYGEALSVLSNTLRFIQSAPKFRVGNSEFSIEICALSVQDMNNVWTLLGGQYHPSVLCKIRGLSLEGEGIASSGTTADRPVVEM